MYFINMKESENISDWEVNYENMPVFVDILLPKFGNRKLKRTYILYYMVHNGVTTYIFRVMFMKGYF